MLNSNLLRKIFTKYVLLRINYTCLSFFNEQDFIDVFKKIIQNNKAGDTIVFDSKIDENYFSCKAKMKTYWTYIQLEGSFQQGNKGTEINLTVQNGSYLKYLNYYIKIGISVMGLAMFVATGLRGCSFMDIINIFIFFSAFIFFPKLSLSYMFKITTKDLMKVIRIISITEVK